MEEQKEDEKVLTLKSLEKQVKIEFMKIKKEIETLRKAIRR